ncbi:MAG TPA: VOC family protein [Sphingomicrobium sp.]|nr:VOC family protein [Sphingomicrobium sp.]
MAKPIPEGYHTVTPYLIIDGAAKAIDFYTQAFGAKEKFRFPMGDRIGHAELEIGDSVIMLADEFPDMGHLGPKALGGTTVSLMVYVSDVDSAFKQAIGAGGREKQPVKDQFYGDRSGTLEDPFGHQWTFSTHVEDVPPEEMQRRMQEFTKSQKQAEPA